MESVERGDGFIFASGWVCYVDNEPVTAPLNITLPDVFTSPMPGLRARPDLASAGIVGPAAFNVAVPLDREFDESTEIVLSSEDETSVVLKMHGLTGSFMPFGSIDSVGDWGVFGWVFDPAVALGRTQVQIMINGGERLPLHLNVERDDLPYSYLGGDRRFGFQLLWSALDAAALEALISSVEANKSVTVEIVSSGIVLDRQILDRPLLRVGDQVIEAGHPRRNPAQSVAPAEAAAPAPVLDEKDLLAQAEQETERRFNDYFDWTFYRDKYMTPSSSQAAAVAHFIATGLDQWNMLSPVIDPTYMREIRPDLFGAKLTVAELLDCLDHNRVDPSPFFSNVYYRSQPTNLSPSESFVGHFIKSGNRKFYNPIPLFELQHYRSRGLMTSAENLADFFHFVARGDREKLSSSRLFDPERYAADCKPGELDTIGPLEHYLRFGRFQGREIYPLLASGGGRELHLSPTAEWVMEAEPALWRHAYDAVRDEIRDAGRRTLIQFAERSILPASREPHDDIGSLVFDWSDDPVIDIIIPAYNEFEHTLKGLRSIRASKIAVPYRVIVIDDASTDPRIERFGSVPGLVYLRNKSNLHFLRSCNVAYRTCTAKFVLLFNNDALLFEDTLAILVEALEGDEALGSVGPKILYPNGRLQEAGCYITSDASSKMIGLGDNPERACYNYDRYVDYISGACVLFRRDAIEGDLFDERFAPAYCEDTDLGLRLRERGYKTKYVAAATAIHHLSVSTGKVSEVRRVRLAARNQQKLFEKWAPDLATKNRVRVLAFYLPQFHPTLENDLWWGPGFTEWTNTAKAVPSYRGHYQPHLPSDLGYYDLRLTDTLRKQQLLADRYGVEGFVVYYYNFGSRRMLWEPMRNLLADKSVNFRFALCWANENWTKHWDGGDKEILVAQEYDDGTLSALCEDFVEAARDSRSLQVDGKPLALVYRPLLLPDIKGFAAMIRASFADAGFPGLHLVYVESMEAVQLGIRPADIGFDACVEFPPQGIAVKSAAALGETKKNWEGNVYDYDKTVVSACSRPPVNYKRYPGVFPSWDNTARQPLKGTSFYNPSPEIFQSYVEAKTDYINDYFIGDERMLFVNAWNEWAEGAHLEPDKAFGHAWLEALRNGISNV